MITKLPTELKRGDLLYVDDGGPPPEVLTVVHERRLVEYGLSMRVMNVPVVCCRGGDRMAARPGVPIRMHEQ